MTPIIKLLIGAVVTAVATAVVEKLASMWQEEKTEEMVDALLTSELKMVQASFGSLPRKPSFEQVYADMRHMHAVINDKLANAAARHAFMLRMELSIKHLLSTNEIKIIR